MDLVILISTSLVFLYPVVFLVDTNDRCCSAVRMMFRLLYDMFVRFSVMTVFASVCAVFCQVVWSFHAIFLNTVIKR